MTQPAEPQHEPPVGTPSQPAPPWGDDADFNPEKAWNLIQNLRGDIDKLKARPVLDDAARTRLEEYDRIQEAAKSELDKANEQLTRWQTDAQTWRDAAVKSKIEALAAADFEYPDDAVSALDASRYIDAGGTIDAAAIQKDLAGLLEARPRWRKDSGQPQGSRPPAPNPAQGSSAAGRAASDPATEFGAILQGALQRQ